MRFSFVFFLVSFLSALPMQLAAMEEERLEEWTKVGRGGKKIKPKPKESVNTNEEKPQNVLPGTQLKAKNGHTQTTKTWGYIANSKPHQLTQQNFVPEIPEKGWCRLGGGEEGVKYGKEFHDLKGKIRNLEDDPEDDIFDEADAIVAKYNRTGTWRLKVPVFKIKRIWREIIVAYNENKLGDKISCSAEFDGFHRILVGIKDVTNEDELGRVYLALKTILRVSSSLEYRPNTYDHLKLHYTILYPGDNEY